MTSQGRTDVRGLRFAREEHGQMFAMAAVLFTLILLVGGLSADYGTTYLAHARFRNAADAAALAGANERQRNPAGGEPAVRAVALQYLALHGYVPDPPQTTINVTLVPAQAGSAETVRVDATRAQPTFFLRLIGISKVDFAATTEAQNGGGFLDIVLSIDITGSMAKETDDLRLAVRAFIDRLAPSTSNPNGPQLAMVVFHGKTTPDWTFPAGSRDVQVATHFTQDKDRLTKLADNTPSAGACPIPNSPNQWPSPQPPFAFTNWAPHGEICPLLPVHHQSGTYVGNGFEAALRPDQGGWNMWASTNGGRPGAKRVLVVITDGSNTVDAQDLADQNAETVASANIVKAGPDGAPATADDIEIFTIGFYTCCADSHFASTTGPSGPPLCPAASIPTSPTATVNDTMMISSSSSKPGSCDHYYALDKSQKVLLPTLFTTIAGQILRSRLSK